MLAVTLLFLGLRNSFFVSLAIPFSMLISFFVLQLLGVTLNMIVLFSLKNGVMEGLRAELIAEDGSLHADGTGEGKRLDPAAQAVVERNMKVIHAALAEIEAAVAADPNYALAHFNLGNLFDELGQTDEARKHYLDALRLNPRH